MQQGNSEECTCVAKILPSESEKQLVALNAAWCVHAGVADAMVGMKAGETRDVRLMLPDNFEPAGLRGCDVTCQVGISELFEYELAEV